LTCENVDEVAARFIKYTEDSMLECFYEKWYKRAYIETCRSSFWTAAGFRYKKKMAGTKVPDMFLMFNMNPCIFG